MLTSCGFVYLTTHISGWSASVPIFYIQRTSELSIPHAPAPKVSRCAWGVDNSSRKSKKRKLPTVRTHQLLTGWCADYG